MRTTKKKNQKHPDHSKTTLRIKRAVGQLQGVEKMVAERRYCPDIIQQLRAVGSAVKAIEGEILKTHVESCIRGAASTANKGDLNQKLGELIKLFK